jgi:hypothetical protein
LFLVRFRPIRVPFKDFRDGDFEQLRHELNLCIHDSTATQKTGANFFPHTSRVTVLRRTLRPLIILSWTIFGTGVSALIPLVGNIGSAVVRCLMAFSVLISSKKTRMHALTLSLAFPGTTMAPLEGGKECEGVPTGDNMSRRAKSSG